MPIEKKPFGTLPSGEPTDLYILKNNSGAWVSITNYGCIITAINVPDKNGNLVDIMLGGKSIHDYAPINDGYQGAVIGRVGNRIGAGIARFKGAHLQLAKNSNGHHLHGGNIGFDKKLWSATTDDKDNSLTFRYTSVDGEENYPGTLHVSVTYAWSEDNALSIHYHATTDKDTLCNLTNHAYFNLNGEGSGTTINHNIRIDADRLTIVDRDCIPTGELRDVTGTAFDLRKLSRIADGLEKGAAEGDEQMLFGSGYDHNFALNGSGYREIAQVTSDDSGIEMTVLTDMPGVQFYGANFLSGAFNGKSAKYNHREGLCLETQYFPDSINHDNFKPCILKADEAFDSTTTYKFSVI